MVRGSRLPSRMLALRYGAHLVYTDEHIDVSVLTAKRQFNGMSRDPVYSSSFISFIILAHSCRDSRHIRLRQRSQWISYLPHKSIGKGSIGIPDGHIKSRDGRQIGKNGWERCLGHRYKHGMSATIFNAFWHGCGVDVQTRNGQGNLKKFGSEYQIADYVQDSVRSPVHYVCQRIIHFPRPSLAYSTISKRQWRWPKNWRQRALVRLLFMVERDKRSIWILLNQVESRRSNIVRINSKWIVAIVNLQMPFER